MSESSRYYTLNNKPIELNNFIGRCGVVPYTITNMGKIALVFGIDRKTGDITDWGGSRNQGESIHEAARRELMEESNEILTCDSSIENCRVGQHGNAITFFVKFDNVTLLEIFPKSFYNSSGSAEMINVYVLSLEDTTKYLKANHFYSLVAEVLLTCMPHLYEIELVARIIFETRVVRNLNS